ncbi:hypothetical protein BDF22DRAFT_744429 [Syncephalis plumigaleata]|nr:hypothetical protein BDF22DRAFT_744429 [Syncephalis plumigaleata]
MSQHEQLGTIGSATTTTTTTNNAKSSRWTALVDQVMNPRNAAIAAGLLLVVSAGGSALLLRRTPSVKMNALPKHFKEIRVPTTTTTTTSFNNYTSKTVPTNGEIEPFSPEARSAGRVVAVQAFLAGSALCLTVSSMIAWGVGRMLGVHNLREFSDYCKEHVPQHAQPFRRLIYRGANEAEVNAIPFDSLADITNQFRIEQEQSQQQQQQQQEDNDQAITSTTTTTTTTTIIE